LIAIDLLVFPPSLDVIDSLLGQCDSENKG
jgi:hypothetical protein